MQTWETMVEDMRSKPQASFRDAMRRLAATVTIVSARRGDRRHGITATAVTSLSMDPASLIICINKSSSLYALLREADRFCVNLLKSEQAELSDHFAGRLSAEERFLHGDWKESEHGVPYLAGAQASVFCTKKEKIDYGSHAIFIGDVEAARIEEKVCPLIYSNGGYVRCLPIDDAA